MKLSLWKPAKPYIVEQAFGIYNPAYLQFGYDHHNGIDISLEPDKLCHAMCKGIVTEVKSYPTGAGNAVRYRTLEPVEAEGQTQYVEFMYMHAEKQLVTVGQVLNVGDPIIIADNTGFSTGPHTHISPYFIDITKPTGENKLPIGSADSDYCFDHSKYFNGYFAEDYNTVIGIYVKLIELLKSLSLS